MAIRRQRVLTAVAALAGLVLFAYSVERVGVAEIRDGIRRVGFGLLPILALGGLRFLIRSESWRLCMPPRQRLPRRQAFAAFLAGDAIGNVTPLGLVASEPTKVLLTRHHLATAESVASLAFDNLIYAASTITMIAIGLVLMLATVSLPFEWQEVAVGILVAFVVLAIIAAWMLRRLRRDQTSTRAETQWLARLADVRDRVVGFSNGHPGRVWRIFLLDMLFHVLAVFEAFLTLYWLLGDRSPALSQAVIFEAMNRVITVVFKFVPLRVGVDEFASGEFARLLGITSATGVALALVRKVRNVFWGGIGLLLIAAHPARGAPTPDHPESVRAHRT